MLCSQKPAALLPQCISSSWTEADLPALAVRCDSTLPPRHLQVLKHINGYKWFGTEGETAVLRVSLWHCHRHIITLQTIISFVVVVVEFIL